MFKKCDEKAIIEFKRTWKLLVNLQVKKTTD